MAEASALPPENVQQRDRELQMPQGETLPYALEHDPARPEDADVHSDGTVSLRLRIESAVAQSVEVVYFDDDFPRCAELTRRTYDAHLEVWESEAISWTAPFEYYFRLQTVSGQALLGRRGLQGSLAREGRFRLPERYPVAVPAWARGAVFYQIFPDRFSRAGTVADALEAWDAPPTQSGFKGGSLAGITSRLDALADLGIDAMWLNPVFRSPSNHGYDIVDFFAVEPRLGTTADLRALTHEAHARGMRVILDGVFNHVSEEHPFFLDVVERGTDSPYWSWFKVRRWPIEARDDTYYAAWWGFGHLPELDLEHPDVQAYFLDVGTHWIREAGVDGWRLDVASEVPLEFWRRFRSAVRAVKPDAYLLAEVWGDARAFVGSDAFDATMHYPFRRAVLEFLRGAMGAEACARHLERLYYRLSKETAEVQYNLLGSHDVSRVRHDLGGDPELVALALAIQFAYPGIAALYYGDEVGLDGAGDPGCRGSYPWDRAVAWDGRDAVRRLTALRRSQPALRHGLVHCRALGPDTLEIERSLAGDVVTLLVDRAARRAEWSVGGSRLTVA
ncbi:MAG: glycoside hydrolase family 13 protein [Trueperaceae bacterium]|nr:glycoside hydrolase family 13 protein [Trueperaceae bacterium]